jgi:cysteine desulfurase/selenocysteine lyase
MDIEEIRSLFPITKEAVYLNSASQAPLNTLVQDKLQAYIASELNFVGKKGFNRDSIRIPLSKLLGGSPEEYALTTSTGVGLGMIAQGIDFKKGDNIILPEKEHWNNAYPWINLESKGVEIRFAKLNKDASINPKAIQKLMDNNTRVVAVAAVRFNTGFRTNLAEIGEIAHSKNALFIVDAAQGAGMVPIDVVRDGIDIMAGCGFKWLLGMHGTGFLYVNKRFIKTIQPVLPGMYAANIAYDELSYHKDARKFETGTLAYPLFEAWSAGLELLLQVGVSGVYENALENTDLLINGLLKKDYHIATPIKTRAERTAILHFKSSSFEKTKVLFEKLTAHKVIVTLQGENIRVSPNFFNTKEEIEKFLRFI